MYPTNYTPLSNPLFEPRDPHSCSVTEEIDFASIDVSFISLKKILPVLFDFLKTDGETVALIKPQFEAGREKVGKKGVVRDIDTH